MATSQEVPAPYNAYWQPIPSLLYSAFVAMMSDKGRAVFDDRMYVIEHLKGDGDERKEIAYIGKDCLISVGVLGDVLAYVNESGTT